MLNGSLLGTKCTSLGLHGSLPGTQYTIFIGLNGRLLGTKNTRFGLHGSLLGTKYTLLKFHGSLITKSPEANTVKKNACH